MSPQTARKIANEYYCYRTSFRRLGAKYDVSPHKVLKAVQELKTASEQQPEKYAVIKIPEKWITGISHLLKSRGIPHEIPEDFELTEYYESSIN